jgi:hypothetical protein
VELGDLAIGRIVYQPGWNWVEDLQARAGTPSCEIRHVGVALSGRLGIEMDDGYSFVIQPLDAFDVPRLQRDARLARRIGCRARVDRPAPAQGARLARRALPGRG